MRAAIVLGGGRSSRMGTDKLALERDGLTLLAHTCRAAGQFAQRVIVAGHEQPDLDVEFVLEDPPFGGPVAGIAAAVEFLAGAMSSPGPSTGRRPPAPEPEVLLLAGDLANPEAVVALLAHSEMGPGGVVLEDHEGWPQYLAGRYRLAALRLAVERAGEVRDLSVRRFLREIPVHQVPAPEAVTADVDTPESALTWGATRFFDNRKVAKIDYDNL